MAQTTGGRADRRDWKPPFKLEAPVEADEKGRLWNKFLEKKMKNKEASFKLVILRATSADDDDPPFGVRRHRG